MTDKELLELAAKAAGIDVEWFDELQEFVANGTINPEWNPLTSDGDALRLAVKLKMNLDCDLHCASTNERNWRDGDEMQDQYAAMRLAIVRAAAAEIGKGMK